MKNLLTLFTFVMIGFFASHANAQKTLQIGPNGAKTLTNSTLWTLNANCIIQSLHQNKIKIQVIKKSGVINGKSLSSGQSTSIYVKNNSNVSVSAEAGTQINLINLGADALQAVCST